MNKIQKASITKPKQINKLFGFSYYFMNQLYKENLLYIESYVIRGKNTKIVISEFLCITFSAEYLNKRKENICRNLGLNPDFFEWY